MNGTYCADPALHMAVVSALEVYGLEANPAAVNRRPQPAGTFAEQMRRVCLGSEVLALVRRHVPVGPDDRALIYRLVDSACRRIEDGELPDPVGRQDVQPAPLKTNPTRRPVPGKPPGSSSPTKTNPTRTIRSSRWSAGGKAVRS
jgi:hypothetical protein